MKALPVCGGLLILLAVAAAQDSGREQVCHHRERGSSRRVDLAAVEREYDALENTVQLELHRDIERSVRKRTRSFDAGLPPCRERAERVESLEKGLPKAFRGRTIWFFDGRDPDRLRPPPEAIRFCLVLSDLEDLGKLRRRFGDVQLCPKRLAEAFGVRCHDAVVTVSEDGKEVTISEGR